MITIFLIKNLLIISDYEIELIVLRDVPCDAIFVNPLLLWLELVIETACYNQRDVRVRFFSSKL